MTRKARSISDKIILSGLLAAATTLASCSSEEVAETPYGTAQQLMANEVQPAADIYWQSVRFESRLLDDGSVLEQEFEPETDEDWARVQAAAARLAELGEVMQTPGYANGRGEDWMIFAQGMVDISKQAEQAAIDQDPDAVFEVGGTVYNVCRACHQMYPPANMPDGVEEADLRPSGDAELEEYIESSSTS